MKKLQKFNGLKGILFVVALTMIGILSGCNNGVNPPTNTAPTFTTNLINTATVQKTSTINFSVVVSDPDGDTLTYAWQESSDNGTTWTSVGTGSNTYGFSKETEGDWKVKVTINDGKNESITSNICSVTVTTTSITYTVTYDKNGNVGGTLPVDNNNYTSGMIVTVFGNTGALIKNDYRFDGWNTKADGTGIDYAAGDTIIMEANNIVLYAKWIAYFFYKNSVDNKIYKLSENGVDVEVPWLDEGRSVLILTHDKESLIYKNTDNKLYRFLEGEDVLVEELDEESYIDIMTNGVWSIIYKKIGDPKLYRLINGIDTEIAGLDEGRFMSLLGYNVSFFVYKDRDSQKLYRYRGIDLYGINTPDEEILWLDEGRSIIMMTCDPISLIYQNESDLKLYRFLEGVDTEFEGVDPGKVVATIVHY